jgi:hypothetical protein
VDISKNRVPQIKRIYISNYIVAVSFIGGGNRRKPPTCRKSLTIFLSHNVVLSTPRLRGGFGGSQLHLYTIATTTAPICYVTYRSYGPMYLFLSRFVLWHLDTEKNHCLGYHKNLFKNLNYVSEKYYFRINWSYYKYIIHYLSFMYLCSLDVKHQSINHVFVRFISYCTVVLHFKMYGWRSH